MPSLKNEPLPDESESSPSALSPQEVFKCACPYWTDAEQCMEIRHPQPLAFDDSDGPDMAGSEDSIEECSCGCHNENKEDDVEPT